jgi:hypothetical protein
MGEGVSSFDVLQRFDGMDWLKMYALASAKWARFVGGNK